MTRTLGIMLTWLLGASAFADSDTLQGAITNGTIKGTVGTYMEYMDYSASRNDYGWGTGYVQLKAESDRYLRTKLGISVIGHQPLWASEVPGEDHYQNDMEKRIGIPELYLDFGLTDESKTTLRIGRWSVKSLTHIDDSHAEGFYLNSKEWENFSFTVGGFRRFAEMDYDDMEDFGRQNSSQFLGSADAFGNDAAAWAFFAEGNADLGALSLNPFVYIHDGYAQVYGLDTDTKVEVAEETSVGLKLKGYTVVADSGSNMNDGWAGMASPYVSTGPFTFSTGYIAMSGEGGGPQENMNKPRWLRDYLPCTDQLLPFNRGDATQGLDSVYVKLKYKQGPFWTHVCIANHEYNSSSIGTGSTELEWQGAYEFKPGISMNLRLFDCEFEGAGGSAIDYQRAELLCKYTF